MKQQAVDDGFTYARKIYNQLQVCIDSARAGQAGAFDPMDGNAIKAWICELGEQNTIYLYSVRIC